MKLIKNIPFHVETYVVSSRIYKNLHCILATLQHTFCLRIQRTE